MKKILLTTSALTMLAGAAAADIGLSGNGRIGVTSAAGVATVDYRLRVYFNGTMETDSGITIGATAGIRWDDPGTTATALFGPTLNVSNGTMTLRVGNTGGAVAGTSNRYNVPVVGYGSQGGMYGGWIGNNHATSTTAAASPNVLALDFALGSANVSISTGAVGGTLANEFGVNFSLGTASVSLGYVAAFGTAAAETQAAVSADLGSASMTVAFAQDSVNGTEWAIGGTTAVGAGTASAYVASQASGGVNTQGWGLGYSQSLGGGATAGLGVASAGGVQIWEAGINFGF